MKKNKKIEARNKRVEKDKAWETSITRKIYIMITYIVVIIYSYFIRKYDNIFLSSLIPVIGFTLSTLSLKYNCYCVFSLKMILLQHRGSGYMNNKGFAISAVLYTLLMAFLLFLGVTLAVFKSSARIIGNSNNDLIDGKKVRVSLVKNTNDYTIEKFIGCDKNNECDAGTCAVTKDECGVRAATAKGYTSCIATTAIPRPQPAQHYWYEYTECKLNKDGTFLPAGASSFSPYGFWHWELINSSNPSEGYWGCHSVLNQTLIKIDSIKGPMFWPRDFGLNLVKNPSTGNIELEGTDKIYKGVAVLCDNGGSSYGCTGKNISTLTDGANIVKIRVGLTSKDSFSSIINTSDISEADYIGGNEETIGGITDRYIRLYDFCN